MATEIGTAYLSLVASTSGLARSVRGQLGQVETAAAASGQRSGVAMGSRLVGGLKKLVTAGGILSVGALAGVAISKGITRAITIEGAEAKLTGLGHSAASVSKIMGNALASVKGTAFGLGDAATVAASLSASGIKQGEQLEGVLKTVADTATISGRSMTDIGAIFGSVAARGKLQGDDMLQLMSSGVPVLQFLSKQTGKTTADVSKMVSKGQIDFATFAAAMKTGLGGAALASGTTFKGALANVTAALGRFGAGLATPALGMLKGVFNDAIPAIDAITAKVAPLAASLGAKLAPIVDRVSKAFFGFIESLASGKGSGIVEQFSGLFAVLNPIGAIVKGMLPAFSSLGGTFKVIGAAIGGALAAVLPVLAQALASVGKALGGAIATILPKVAPLFTVLGQAVASLAPVLGQVATVLAGALGQVLPIVATAVSGLVGALTPLLPVVAQLISSLLPPLANIIGLVVSAITPLIPIVVQVITSALGPLIGIVSQLITSLAPFLPIVDGLIGSLLPPLAQLLGVVLQALMPIVKVAVSLVQAFVPLIAAILPPLVQLLQALMPVITLLAGALGQILTPIIGALGQILTGLLVPILSKLIGVLAAVLPPVIRFATTILNRAVPVLTALIGVVVKVAAAIARWVGDSVGKVAAFAGNVGTYIGNVVKFFTDVPGKIKGALTGAGTWLLDTGKNVVQGLLDGAGSLLSTIGTFFLDKIPGWIKGPFKKALGIHSPSKVFHGYGANIIHGLVNGLDDNRDRAGAAITRIVNKIKDTKGLVGESALVKWVKGEGKQLDAAWKAYDKSATKLKAAKDKLAQMQQASAQLKGQVASGITGQLDLTAGISKDTTDANGYTVKGKTTFASVASVVSSLAAKAKTFAGKLKALVKKGIPQGLVQQVAGLGIDDGLAVANALLSGSSAQVKQLRADWSTLTSSASKAGSVVADQLYGAGIAAQEGIVKGLTSDTKKLQKAAEHIADVITKSVKKKLGIHSPSRVFDREVGQMVPAGIIAGFDAMQSTLDGRTAALVDPSLANTNVKPGAGDQGRRNFTDADIAAFVEAMRHATFLADFPNDRAAAAAWARGKRAAEVFS